MTKRVMEYEILAKCVLCGHRWPMSQDEINTAAEKADCAFCPKEGCGGPAVVEKANVIFFPEGKT